MITEKFSIYPISKVGKVEAAVENNYNVSTEYGSYVIIIIY